MNHTIRHRINTTPPFIEKLHHPGWTKVFEEAVNTLAAGDVDGAIELIIYSESIDQQSQLFCLNELAKREQSMAKRSGPM